jgi:hypothetical protein
MPTRTQQGDLLSIAYLSHGDTKHIALFPANPGECFTLAVEAFDLAERFQTPVFVVSDLDIGMNDWMCPRFTWSDGYRPDRGKVLGPAELEKGEVLAPLDVDGDGIAANDPGARGAVSRRLGHKVRHFTGARRVSGVSSVGKKMGRRRAVRHPERPPPRRRTSIVSIGGVIPRCEDIETAREGSPSTTCGFARSHSAPA